MKSLSFLANPSLIVATEWTFLKVRSYAFTPAVAVSTPPQNLQVVVFRV